MISIPPHCSHRMQPLDIGVFGPFKKLFYAQCQAWMKTHPCVDIEDVPSLADKCLDLTVTPRNIKKAFLDTGIFPFDPHRFTDEDFIAADIIGEEQCSDDDDDGIQNNRIIVFSGEGIAAHEEVATSDAASTSSLPSTSSMPSTSAMPGTSSKAGKSSNATISAAALQQALKEVSPLKPEQTVKKSTGRGRKPMKSTVLTSDENVKIAHEKADDKKKKAEEKEKKAEKKKQKAEEKEKKAEKKKQKGDEGPPAKRSRRTKSVPAALVERSSDEDVDFCIICMGNMPKKLTSKNSIQCIECEREVHLKCANMTRGYWMCSHCEEMDEE